MKTALMTLAFVFAVTAISAQGVVTLKNQKKRSEPIRVQTPPPTMQIDQDVYNLRLHMNVINILLVALKNSQDLNAKVSNEVITLLVNQVNDSTLNRPVPTPAVKPKEK